MNCRSNGVSRLLKRVLPLAYQGEWGLVIIMPKLKSSIWTHLGGTAHHFSVITTSPTIFQKMPWSWISILEKEGQIQNQWAKDLELLSVSRGHGFHLSQRWDMQEWEQEWHCFWGKENTAWTRASLTDLCGEAAMWQTGVCLQPHHWPTRGATNSSTHPISWASLHYYVIH